MSNVGPVCHIPPKNTPANPQPTNMPGLPPPVSPPQSNNPGQNSFNNEVASAINSILQMLRSLSSQTQQLINNNGTTNNATSAPSGGSWSEAARQTTKVRVYQNNDKTSQNFVDVEQINQLSMKNSKTKDTWTWTRGS